VTDVSDFKVTVRTGTTKPPRPEPNHVEDLLREWFPDASYHQLEAMAAKARWAVGMDTEGRCEGCFW
jgi:hypothetical protein